MSTAGTLSEAYAALAGAIGGAAITAVVSTALHRLNTRHQRKLLVFQVEIEEIKRVHNLIADAYRAYDNYHFYVTQFTSTANTNKPPTTVDVAEREAYAVIATFAVQPLTTDKRFLELYASYVKAFFFGIEEISKLLKSYSAGNKPVMVNADMAKVDFEDIHNEMSALLMKSLDNFEKGKPTFR